MSDQAPTKKEIVIPQLQGDLLMLRIARSIAQDISELDKILATNGVTHEQWAIIERHPRFQKYLQASIIDWNAAENTPERVKVKSAAMVEEWLPEAFRQMHSPEAPLLHRNDLAKLVARLGGMEKSGSVAGEVGGERFHVTINLGADAKLNFDKTVPMKTINLSPNDNSEDESTKVWGNDSQ